MALLDLPADSRPREKLLARGAGALSDTELLALLLRTGLAGKGVMTLAQELVETFGGLAGLLHTDARVLPKRHLAWAAWNYERAASTERESSSVCLHYLLNLLQRIPFAQPVVVSLNPLHDIDPATIVGEYDYAHPVFDLAAIEAQKRLPLLQGQQHTWYAGAWTGYGFHEDGLKSGLQVGRALLKLIHDQASPVQDRLAA